MKKQDPVADQRFCHRHRSDSGDGQFTNHVVPTRASKLLCPAIDKLTGNSSVGVIRSLDANAEGVALRRLPGCDVFVRILNPCREDFDFLVSPQILNSLDVRVALCFRGSCLGEAKKAGAMFALSLYEQRRAEVQCVTRVAP